ncbi:MAG TPA: class I SAM-dependent methyltransferase [Gemmatimonadaceae bacterium]|jgi:SAM-dependent methyltransferase
MQIRFFAEAPLWTRCFLWLRSILTPYESIASALPAHGRILDLGSGHGLLAFALALGSDQREIIGIDHDPERVRLAKATALRLPVTSRPAFEVGDLRERLGLFSSGSLAGIAMIDILHYFDPANQRLLVSEAARVLAAGGVLVVREIDSDAGVKAAANRLYERLATGIGFTKSAVTTLSFKGARGWTSLLEGAGFAVRSEPCGPPFLADVLFVAKRSL